VPTFTGTTWPYVIVPDGFTADPSISANITIGANDILLINGWPAYQFVNDLTDQDVNGTFGPWFYFETDGALSQDACPPVTNPAEVSILELECGGEVLQVTGSFAGSTGGGTATSATRTIYAYQPDGPNGVPTFTGTTWPYVVVPDGFTADPSISANITVGANDILLINGWPAYQFVNDLSDQDVNGTFGPWFYFETDGALSQDACPPVCENPFPAVDDNSLNATITGNSVILSWDPVPFSIGCQLQGRKLGSTEVLSVQALGFEVSEKSFSLSNLELASTYGWRVRCGCSVDPVVAGPWSAVATFTTPNGTEIVASPNPTEGISNVTLSVEKPGYVTLEVYDMSGRMVGAIFSGVAQPNNNYRFEFDGSFLPNGVYIYRLTTENDVQTEKFMISR